MLYTSTMYSSEFLPFMKDQSTMQRICVTCKEESLRDLCILTGWDKPLLLESQDCKCGNISVEKSKRCWNSCWFIQQYYLLVFKTTLKLLHCIFYWYLSAVYSMITTETCAGILEQSMGARNQVGKGLSYRPARQHRLVESIPGFL